MRVKKLIGMLMCGVVLANTIPVNAFTNSCAGQWADVTGANFNYNSDGTLVIRGKTGDEVLTNDNDERTIQMSVESVSQELSTNWERDVKSIIIDNVDTFGTATSNRAVFYSISHNINYISINAKTIGSVFSYLVGVDTIVLGDRVETIGDYFIYSHSSSDDFTIYIPSTVTYISENAYQVSDADSFSMTVVCEYGTAGYNWANYMKNKCPNATVNIELYETQATSQVVIDNRALYQIVVPENTKFKYTSDGWVADTFCGVVGTLPEGLDLTIKTDEEFRVIGDEIIAVEKVSTTTEDPLSNTANGIITTTLDKATLDSKPHEIQINDTTTEQGYKVDYKCKTQSPHLMKQAYSGVIKFLIN